MRPGVRETSDPMRTSYKSSDYAEVPLWIICRTVPCWSNRGANGRNEDHSCPTRTSGLLDEQVGFTCIDSFRVEIFKRYSFCLNENLWWSGVRLLDRQTLPLFPSSFQILKPTSLCIELADGMDDPSQHLRVVNLRFLSLRQIIIIFEHNEDVNAYSSINQYGTLVRRLVHQKHVMN